MEVLITTAMKQTVLSTGDQVGKMKEKCSYFAWGKTVGKTQSWVLLGEMDQVWSPKQSKVGNKRDLENTGFCWFVCFVFFLPFFFIFNYCQLCPSVLHASVKIDALGDAMTQVFPCEIVNILRDWPVYEWTHLTKFQLLETTDYFWLLAYCFPWKLYT